MPMSDEFHDSTDDHQSRFRPRRRMSDAKVQAIADSPYLKVFAYVMNFLLTISVALIAWGAGSILDRLAKIEGQLNAFTTANATIELRIKSLEDYRNAAESRGRTYADRLLLLEAAAELDRRRAPRTR